MRHVIVGGGIAGVTLADELRARDPSAEIVLLGAEGEPLYSRMLLKEYAKGAVGEPTLRVHDERWYAGRDIDFRPGVRATGTEGGRVLTDAGEDLAYDRLFAAAGGSQTDPFGIAERAENAGGLWTLREARRIRERIESGQMEVAVVIGAGFLGLELADALATQGVETHFVMRGHWSRHGMGRDGAEIVHRALEAHGVAVHDGQRVEGFEVQGDRVVAVRTERRELPCDYVGLAVGLGPNVGYLGGTGAEVRGGVLVDEHMRSADPAVLAAGDVAEYRDVVLGGRRRSGTWLGAIDQARVAAENARSGDAVFETVEAHSVAVAGLDAPVVFLGAWDGGDEALDRRFGETRYRRVALRDGRPVGASLVGERGDVVGQLKRLIRRGPALDERGRAAVLEPHLDTDEICRASAA